MKTGYEPIPQTVRDLRDEAGTGSGTIPLLNNAANEIMTLRRLLAFAYSGGNLYGDDGELQDSRYPHPIDYMRDAAEAIEEKIHARGMDSLIAWIKANPEEAEKLGYKFTPADSVPAQCNEQEKKP